MPDRTIKILINAKDQASAAFGKLFKTVGGLQTTVVRFGQLGGVALASLTAAAGGASAALLASAKHFADVGSELNDISARSGIGVEALAELGHSARMTGGELSDVETAIKKMQQTIADAATGQKTAAETLSRIGLSAARLRQLKPEDQFQLIADQIARIPDPAQRTAIAVDLLGRSGTKLLPMMANLRELREEARRLGVVLSRDQVDAADALGDAMDRAKASISGLTLQFGAAMAPALTDASDKFSDLTARLGQQLKPAAEEVGGLLSDIINDLSAGDFSLADNFAAEMSLMAKDLRDFLDVDWKLGWDLAFAAFRIELNKALVIPGTQIGAAQQDFIRETLEPQLMAAADAYTEALRNAHRNLPPPPGLKPAGGGAAGGTGGAAGAVPNLFHADGTPVSTTGGKPQPSTDPIAVAFKRRAAEIRRQVAGAQRQSLLGGGLNEAEIEAANERELARIRRIRDTAETVRRTGRRIPRVDLAGIDPELDRQRRASERQQRTESLVQEQLAKAQENNRLMRQMQQDIAAMRREPVVKITRRGR